MLIMYANLTGDESLHHAVEGGEFETQSGCSCKAVCEEQDFCNQVGVRHHHCYRSEVRLQIIRQFHTPSIAIIIMQITFFKEEI